MTRTANFERNTKETQVSVTINCDGSGKYDINTGVGFLDHMLEQLAKHSSIDLTVKAVGDLHIDFHHTVEDVAITIGKTMRKALGDCKGITRFAHAYVPMDETLTRVCVDISSRPYLIWKVNFSQDKIGDIDTELFREWFYGFTFNLGANINIENICGVNNHHIIESCFKALALSLKAAIKIDPNNIDNIPSTKGVL